MNYGMQLAASGALVGLYRMDVLANNLANMGTTAFKADVPAARQRDAERIEDKLSGIPSNSMLERLGGGVMAAPNRIDLAQGPVTTSGNQLDVALEGPGFFVVRDEAAKGGDSLRLTRDGRWLRDSQGRLASAATGMPVMDVSNRPIHIGDDAPVQIDASGDVRQHGSTLGRVQVVDFADASHLAKRGAGLYAAPPGLMSGRRPAAGEVRQYALESSAVDPMKTLMALTEAQKSVDYTVMLMQGHDRLADRAINGLGRVS